MSDGWVRFLGDVLPCQEFNVELDGDRPIVLNLESPITTTHSPAMGKVVLRSDADWLTPAFGKALRVACLANNHIMDHGGQGLTNTIAALESKGIDWFGAGPTRASVRNGIIVGLGGFRVGFAGYVCPSTNPIYADDDAPGVVPPELGAVRADLASLRDRGANRVVVCLHWGAEEVPYPRPGDVVLARAVAELGADLIIGHHSHCIQPYEIRNRRPIFYGIGNAVMPDLDLPCNFDSANQPTRRFVKHQRRWNRRSLAVDYHLETRQVHVQRARFDGSTLSFHPGCVSRSLLLNVKLRYQANVFRMAGVYGQVRNLVAGFVERPRLPQLHHIKSLWKGIE